MIANSPCNSCLSSQVCMYKRDAQAIWDTLQNTSYKSESHQSRFGKDNPAYMPLKTEKNFTIAINCNHAIYRDTLLGGDE